MEVVALSSDLEVATVAADVIESIVRRHPEAVVGLATGSTPGPTYRELIRRHQSDQGPDYDRVQVFILDEYVGLAPNHPKSYRQTIARELTDDLGLAPDRVHGPDMSDVREAGSRYESKITGVGGIDIQLLGIGTDGHLAFNEPGSSLASLTRLKTLTPETRRDNARFFACSEDVPRHAITQGLGTIQRARQLLLIATGAAKAGAIAAAVEGPLTSSCPASVIQLHPHATVLVDFDAASGLRRLEYYRHVYETKPDWKSI